MKHRTKKKKLSRLRAAKARLRKYLATLAPFEDLTKAEFNKEMKLARNKIKAHKASRKARK